ncbi:MAG: acyltransferase, partial [Proteobacteria bacterium]
GIGHDAVVEFATGGNGLRREVAEVESVLVRARHTVGAREQPAHQALAQRGLPGLGTDHDDGVALRRELCEGTRGDAVAHGEFERRKQERHAHRNSILGPRPALRFRRCPPAIFFTGFRSLYDLFTRHCRSRRGLDPRHVSPLKYVPALDGIRGFAVLIVMLFHFGWLAPGWIGVQIFFVLSGFLITRILLQNRQESLGADFRRFYWRRTLRIFPVLVLVLAVSALLYLSIGVPASFGHDWPWLVGFAANLGRVWGAQDIGHYHVHMWSLAVEEQFYLLWPFALFLLPVRHVKTLVVALLIGAPVLRYVLFQWLTANGTPPAEVGIAVYVLPFTQFDAFATGAALAVWPKIATHRFERSVLVVLALAAVGGLVSIAWGHLRQGGAYYWAFGYEMYLRQALGYVWGYTVLNLVGLMLVAGTYQGHAWTRPLGVRPLIGLGRISYGVYVYHLPLLAACREFLDPRFAHRVPGWPVVSFCGWVLATLAVAMLSYRYIEAPLLRLKDRRPSAGVTATA